MDELVRAGKVRFIGASNYAAWQICHMLWLAKTNGWQPVTVVQPMYNLLARGIEQELLPMCASFGLAVVPYNPLAGGLLTGKHTAAKPIADSRFERMPLYRDRYWHEENFAAVQRLHDIARSSGRLITHLAIGWLLQNAGVTSVILGHRGSSSSRTIWPRRAKRRFQPKRSPRATRSGSSFAASLPPTIADLIRHSDQP